MSTKPDGISNVQMVSLTVFIIVILYILLILLGLSQYETMSDELDRIKQEIRTVSIEIKESKCKK